MELAYFTPFDKAAGVTIQVATYDGIEDRFTRMVKSGKATWDVMQVESRLLEQGCKEGWFEKVDVSKIGDKADFVPGSLSECGVGIFAWSQALAYDAYKLSVAPSSWADFWDVKKFPGKRGLRRSAKYTLEIALMADGVAPADVYKLLATKQGADRAFRKLDQIKANTVWWQAAPQPSLLLAADKVVMTSAYALWIGDDQQRRGKNFKIVWNGSLHDFDSWVILKGAPQTAEAYKFIAFASKPENQKTFVTELAYGPTNRKTMPLLAPALAGKLPTAEANLKGTLRVDIPFWVRHGAALEQRFADWVPPLQPTADEQEEEHHGKKGAPAPGHAH